MPPRQPLVLGLTGATHALQDGISLALNLILPLLAQTFGLSYAQVGLIRALKSSTMALCEIPSGILAERLGERYLLVFGLVCTGVGGLSLALAGGLGVVLAGFMLIGIGSGFQHALSSAVISREFGPASRRRALGLYNSAGDGGKLIFTALVALGTGAGLAWQNMMLFISLLIFTLAVVLLVVFGRLGLGTAKKPQTATDSKGWGIQNKSAFGQLCLTVFIDTLVQSGFMVFLVFLMVEKGMALSLSGLALVLTLIGGMFGKAGCGFLAQKIGPRTTFTLAQLATALGIIVLLNVSAMAGLVLLPILGLFLQGTTSVTYGTVSELVAPQKHARGFALIYSVSALSSITGPIVFGLISDAQGLNRAMATMAAVALLAIVPGLLLPRQD